MKKKMILLIAVVLLALAVLCIALLLGSDAKKDEAEASTQSEQSAETPAPSDENQPASVYENGIFTFTAGQFRERFADTLPEGYTFADTIAANASRNDKMQIDILDATGTPAEIAILMDVKDPDLPCSQMALVIKEDGYEEDAAAMLNWYLSTFLDSLEAEKQTAIYEDYLDMFCTRSEDYRLYSEDSIAAMMSRGMEESGNYYYVMISVQ